MSDPADRRLTSVSADLLAGDRPRARAIVYGVAGLVAAAIAWSCVATVLEVSSGTGRVIPERRLQRVQSLDGGVVLKILKRAGDRVATGETLALLDPVYARSTLKETLEQAAGLAAAAVRLRALLAVVTPPGMEDEKTQFRPSGEGLMALAESFDPEYPPEIVAKHGDLARLNTDQFRTALRELGNSVAAIEQQLAQKTHERAETAARLASAEEAAALARDEHESLKRLGEQGAASKAEVNAARSRRLELESAAEQLKLSLPRFDAAVAEITSRLDERINGFRSEIAASLNDSEVRWLALTASSEALERRSRNTTVTAPAAGILKAMNVTTEGQVVKAGEDIAEIVPVGEELLIEVRLRPEDIAFVEPGMGALIKLTAYDYSIFGAIPGKVERVAEDSTTDDKGTTYYLADVRAASDHVERQGVRWPIRTGMVANVDVVTGKRTIFQYLTKPIHRLTQSALRER